jgi:hypothetical protein
MIDLAGFSRARTHRTIHDFTSIKSRRRQNRSAPDPDYNKGSYILRVGGEDG